MEIKVPEVGESIYEALVAKWHVQDSSTVKKDELLCELETDKITLELNAETAGVISIKVAEGETVKIGTVIATIAEGAATSASVSAEQKGAENAPVLPAARKLAEEQGIAVTAVAGSGRGGRVTVEDVLKERVKTEIEVEKSAEPQPTVRTEEPPLYRPQGDGRTTRTAMTPIRRRIAERLLAARQQTAMLTTFNEADLSAVIALRKKHREHFLQKHGISLGLMSFFVRACCEALREFPTVNASIDGNDIVYHHYFDIGIAIGAEKGLVVPVLRDADRLHFFEIEQKIEEYVSKVKTNKLAIADLEGGTFSISNGGVYGSLLSTPILNPPQSGVLGMHAIQERAVVRDGQVVIRPMMYLALSYDHRIIDGRVAVGFLRKVKEYVEDPEELLLEG